MAKQLVAGIQRVVPKAGADVRTPSFSEPPRFSREERILSEQVNMVYGVSYGFLAAGAIGAFLLLVGLYGVAPPLRAVIWLVSILAMMLILFVLTVRYQRAKPGPGEVRAWAIRSNIVVLVLGLAWGAAGIAMFENTFASQVLLTLALVLVSVLGVTGACAKLSDANAFNIPILAPLTIRIAVEGDREHIALAVGLFVIMMLLLYLARHFHALIMQSIQMRFENEELNEALTEQRVKERTRALEIASQHKSEFLANMSHELRTPLNSVIGFSEVLRDGIFGAMNDKQTEYVQDIHASGHHLLALINDILDLSKVEAGRMELTVDAFDLPAAIDNSVMLVHERAARRQLTISVQVDEQFGSFSGDERKFKQILLNLLSNAIKFTPEGGSIFVQAMPTSEGVRISVRDTGVGIAPEHHEEIFQAFHQVGDSTNKPQGTGLGLTLVKQFVELHGGRIGVVSALNQGSTFTFTLAEQHGERTDIDH
jgi:signal transduction histidine kinase